MKWQPNPAYRGRRSWPLPSSYWEWFTWLAFVVGGLLALAVSKGVVAAEVVRSHLSDGHAFAGRPITVPLALAIHAYAALLLALPFVADADLPFAEFIDSAGDQQSQFRCLAAPSPAL
jgi:hypothetical protein